jgi:hypothetical protein
MPDYLLLRRILFSFHYGLNPYTVLHTALTEYTHRIPRHSIEKPSSRGLSQLQTNSFYNLKHNHLQSQLKPRDHWASCFFCTFWKINSKKNEICKKRAGLVVLGKLFPFKAKITYKFSSRPETSGPAVLFSHSCLFDIYLPECAKKTAGPVVLGILLPFKAKITYKFNLSPETSGPAVFCAHSFLFDIYLPESAKKTAGPVVSGLELNL